MKKLVKKFLKKKVHLWKLLLLLLAMIAFFAFAFVQGRLSEPKNVEKTVNQTTTTYETIKKLEKVEELTLLNVRIQKVKTISNNTKIFGKKILGTEKSAIVILNYDAKLGIKENVKID